ncbi:MAG: hypothetical protein HC933_02210 [Pleurocapsa sp. SU_196_0]|nr:hypothetical protein [Pleurocapsa sp. SU_196_0]
MPAKYIGTWQRRKNVGIVSVKGKRGRSRKFLAAGVFVGGKNSTLDHGAGLSTRGERDSGLPAGKVGFSAVRHTVRTQGKRIALNAFLRGYRGR